MLPVTLVPVKKAAERLSISKSGVYNLMDSGHLAWVKVGSARRIREADIDAYIERNTHGGHAAPQPEPNPEPPTNSLTVEQACIGKLHVPRASAKPARKGSRKPAKGGSHG